MAEHVLFLGGVIEVANACHHFTCFLDEGVIEAENASGAVVEAFSEPEGVELAQIPAMPRDESVQ